MNLRWFCLAKFSDTYRLRSVHDADGQALYVNYIQDKPEGWWVFRELEPLMEKPEGPLKEGVTCCLLYPILYEGDKIEQRHVLACVYSHKPLAGYPRFYQVAPDDLPSEVREGCWHDKDQRLYFPDNMTLPESSQPIYGILGAAAPGEVPVEDIVEELIGRFGRIRGSEEPVPGG